MKQTDVTLRITQLEILVDKLTKDVRVLNQQQTDMQKDQNDMWELIIKNKKGMDRANNQRGLND